MPTLVLGTSGRVLATDIDVSWIEPAAGVALEVRRHDVIRDPPPSETFDLIHARLVLVHLEDRAVALQVMIDALAHYGIAAGCNAVVGECIDHDLLDGLGVGAHVALPAGKIEDGVAD